DGMPDGWEASNNLNATSASNADGANGDPDGDGLINLYEYINPSWTTTCGGQPCYRPGPSGSFTETTTPCSPHLGIGPGGCATMTAETDGVTSTNPLDSDTDNDGLNDSHEALTLLTDPTNADTDGDGINDGVEINGQYGSPAQASDPRNNNTDGDAFDDGDEDKNGNGLIDANETDPTRREDSGDFDNDGLENWQENLSCTSWNVADTDSGGVNDGDESNASHGTDPCDSLIQFTSTIVSYNSGSSQLTLTDASGLRPSGGIAFYNNSGAYTQFSYGGVVNSVLQGVSVTPPSGASIESRNNSWCHDISGGSFPNYCDDDYSDSDGDGLADWEETLGVHGYFSNPTLADSDGDGVIDYDEVMSGTDPMEPCDNNLDDDGDGLNNYFEVTTGCDNSWIGITNGSQDIWSTDDDNADTDSGGVNDKQEYFDSSNPENDPTDDLLPEDFDGDGIPDAVENQTGTDWRNPDTDGGGMLDGDECPQLFWFTNCAGSPFNPWDPSDDADQNEVVFWANNTSGVVDLERVHRWRVHTYDFYTGAAYGLETDVHPYTDITVPYTNMTHLAPSTYGNDTVAWNIAFANPVLAGKVPMSAYQFNITFWSDATLAIARSNDTHSYDITAGLLTEMWVEEYEYWFDWDTIAANTIAGTNSSYETILPQQFLNSSLPESLIMNITNEVISSAGATDAYSKADAIATFLRDGNATYDFKRNYNGSGAAPEADISYELLNRAKEGTCAEFTSVFVTMARSAGLPARFVTGYSGGSWTGNGYAVYGANLNQWGEVRLEMSPGSGGDDLGWIPFEACPAPEEIEIVNITWTPTSYDRTGLVEMNVSGTLQYVDNVTVIPDVTLRGFVVSAADAGDVPGPAASIGNLFGTITTDSNGNFSMNGTMDTPATPGFASIVIEHIQSGYVSHDGIDLGVFVNMTDDSNITHNSPGPADSPVLGAGATTVVSGQLLFAHNETGGSEDIGPLTVWLDFTSSEDGATNLSGTVGPGGVWEINVTLDELETKTNISATLGFSGWQDTSQSFAGTPQFHLRPSTHSITLDIRDAPNLTATIEGPGANNSILQIDELVYINGSTMSFGAVPSALSGNLSFGMRELNGGGTFVELFNQTVNGAFSISHILDINTTYVKAGEIELSLVFYPDSLNATDALNTSGSPWWLQGLLFLELQAQSQLRGNPVGIIVQVTDHLGGELDLNLSGNFTFDFDGTTENTTTDPGSSTLSPTFTTSSSLDAGDYAFDMAFDGNMYYLPSSNSSTLRIMGTIDVNVVVINDWTYLGNTTWVVGDISDDVTGAAVLGNDSIIMVQLLTVMGPIDLANGLLNNTTGTYNVTIVAPTNLPSGVYDLQIMTDFDTPSQPGGPYYQYVDAAVPPALPQMPSTTWGIESDVIVETPEGQPADIIAIMNSSVDLNSWVGDVADNSNVSGAQVNYILDYGGANISIGNAISDAEGNATLLWTVSGVDPGQYILRMEVLDDVSSPKIAGATRHWGNFTEVNVTVQVPSNIRVDSIPSTITAGVNFQVMGQVEDGDNASRNLTTAVALEMFWLDNPDEKLVNGVYTAINGSFNLSVPTDVLSNGTLRGPRTFVISVVEGSSAFYLTDTSNHSILVQGVTLFESMQPLNPMVVNRGEDVNMTLQMVESSNMWQPLGGYTIDVKFDETWLASNTTDAQGRTSFVHTIPFDQPLGLISISFYYNGSFDLLPAQRNLSTVTVRSITIMVVDPIVANPVAGDAFTITGTIESDNGSGLQLRNGAALSASVLFLIDDQPTGFTLSNGQILANGTWEATIALGSGFMAGTHIAEAQYIPSVNYYSGSSANQSFDSRGYTTLTFLTPTLDGVNQPSLNDRTDRGDDVNARLQLFDNTGSPVVGVQVTVTLNGTPVTTVGTTDALGIVDVNLTTPANLPVGFHNLNAEFLGTPGTIGLIGDNTSVLFVVLGQTEINITESSSAITAGDILYVNGTLLDDLGNPLQIDGVDSIAVVYLLIDGVPVSSVQSNSADGVFMFAWTSPENIAAGPHNIQTSFTGGRDWVNPIGEGDSANPEYYHASVDSVNFTVAVPTKILLLTQGGQVDREDTLTVQGRLLDIVDNPLEGETIEIWLGGIFLTNVTTGADGTFNAVHPVPADAELGPVLLETRFTGTLQYLPSSNNGTWNIYSKIFVEINIESPLAVDQMTTLDGFVGDNQMNPLSNMVVLVSIEGISIGNATTDANGNFSFDWQVPNIFTDGDHIVDAEVPAQGWYRAGQGNTTFFLAHRTGITIDIVDNDATRDDFWEVSGTLYDVDTALNDGLPGETILIYIDGSQVATAITSINGEFTTDIRAESAYARGAHLMTFSFEGSAGHLPIDSNSTVLVWADVTVHIDSAVSYVVRGDGINNPIVITGRVTEIGGQGVTIDAAELILGEGVDCGSSGSDARCINSNIIWNGGTFTLTAIAPSWMEPGPTQLSLQTPVNSSLYLRTGDAWTNSIAITIDATFDVDIEPIIEDEQEVVMGEITVTADDTGQGVEGIVINVYLEYANGIRINDLTIQTDSDGLAEFEFNSEIPYGDYSEYGPIVLKMTVTSNGILSTESVNAFNNDFSAGKSPDYTFADEGSNVPWWAYIVALLVIGAGAAFVIMRRRADEAAKELADIFSYTAELLAAGDSMREAIFQCYESLVHVLMGRGFLRRDFETVREFEMAIRSALPQLSEDALNALDNVFEEARYSRHEMGESHKANAQEALTRVVSELGQVIEIPNR
ncbi:MAG: hypothetical protein HOM47_02945, partial [Euryarchaeota archaeon]|nr:hypothetical protein [Euryarchaeota archaeon]